MASESGVEANMRDGSGQEKFEQNERGSTYMSHRGGSLGLWVKPRPPLLLPAPSSPSVVVVVRLFCSCVLRQESLYVALAVLEL